MAKTIAIIGAGGQMGKWLANYFVKKGFDVTGFDIENPIPTNIRQAGSLISAILNKDCLLYTSPSPRDLSTSRMTSSA